MLSHVTRYVEDRAMIVEVEAGSLAEKVGRHLYQCALELCFVI